MSERFWAKVNKHGPVPSEPWQEITTACWIWTAALNDQGYGHFGVSHSRIVRAHRYAYELVVGAIPDGLTLDHLCRVRACVRPDHLEVVPHRTNLLRGTGASARNARKTHCPQGHPYDDANTYITPAGHRQCLLCRRAYDKRRSPRRRSV